MRKSELCEAAAGKAILPRKSEHPLCICEALIHLLVEPADFAADALAEGRDSWATERTSCLMASVDISNWWCVAEERRSAVSWKAASSFWVSSSVTDTILGFAHHPTVSF